MTFPPETVERVARAIFGVAGIRQGLSSSGRNAAYESLDDKQREIVRDYATAALAAAWEWRPIEEVPKDGTEILLFDGVNMWSDKWDDDFKDWDVSPFSEPTHWIPLPTRPADVKGEVG